MSENGHGLTLRELVLEIREDVKDIKDNYAEKEEVEELDKRVTVLESIGFRLSGAWTMLGILAATCVGIAGLVVATVSAVGV